MASELEIFESARLRTCSGQENLYHDTDLDIKNLYYSEDYHIPFRAAGQVDASIGWINSSGLCLRVNEDLSTISCTEYTQDAN